MTPIDEPLYTIEMRRDEFDFSIDSTLIFASSGKEERGKVPDQWLDATRATSPTLVEVFMEHSDSISVSVRGQALEVSLFDANEVRAVLDSLPQPVYLDITSLAHNSWAPIVKTALQSAIELIVLYVEPGQYRRDGDSSDMFIDLSERIDGVRPVPGFVSLAPKVEDRGFFVPMIGFEGARFAHLIEDLDPIPEVTFPVIGVPGFRPEYSFYTYSGNRDSLARNYIHNRVQYAKANCPFSAFHVLEDVHNWAEYSHLRIAPIGTKPHALGAVLFAISRGSSVELIYDHPVKANKRTQGEARLCVFYVSAFSDSKSFNSAAGRAIKGKA